MHVSIVGFIISVIILSLVTGFLIWLLMSYIKNKPFEDIYNKKIILKDPTYHKSLDGCYEFHQYSFHSSVLEEDWIRKTLPGIEIGRNIHPLSLPFSLYHRLRYGIWDYIFQETEIIKKYNDNRFDLKDKVVIVEHTAEGKIKLMVLFYTVLSMFLFLPLFLSLFLSIEIRNNMGNLTIFAYLHILTILTWLLMTFSGFWNIIKIKKFINQQKFESIIFQENFDAYSQNPIESRMIITPAFMDKLNKFTEKYHLNGKVRIIIKEKTLTFIFKGDIANFGFSSTGIPILFKSFEDECGISYMFK